MRCPDLAGLLLLLTALSGCAAVSTRIGGRSLLGGYKIMDAPTADMPIGALWKQGYGPVGPGATPDNLVTRRSFSSLTLNRAARRGVEVQLANYLGLQPESSARLTATISEVSIASVRDVGALGYQPGDAFLSDGMRASKIAISTESEAEAQLVAGLQARGLRVTGQGSGGGREVLTVEGVDLFFAYRVVRLKSRGRRGGMLTRVLKRPRAPGW